jgi:hypothetical protein
MQLMRTPETRFTGLPDRRFAPQHLDLPPAGRLIARGPEPWK